jgi:hypothetical protein
MDDPGFGPLACRTPMSTTVASGGVLLRGAPACAKPRSMPQASKALGAAGRLNATTETDVSNRLPRAARNLVTVSRSDFDIGSTTGQVAD